MIGATTLDEYRKHIEKDAALERRFATVWSASRASRTPSPSCAG
jgi:ATP-dependent Clp protease ATP-binding subunit ClpA